LASSLFKKLTFSKPSTVLLPGGNTPKVFFRRLINDDVNWHDISLMASDERVVPLNSNNSNMGMIQRELYNHINEKVKPNLIKLYPVKNNDIKNSLNLLDQYLSNNCPKIAFLGIGKDGHTAGIFKDKKTNNNCYVLKNKMDSFYRITISMKILINIPYLIFFVLGSDKKKIIENILSDIDSEEFIPARFLLKNGFGKKIILCDKKAAPDNFSIGVSVINL